MVSCEVIGKVKTEVGFDNLGFTEDNCGEISCGWLIISSNFQLKLISSFAIWFSIQHSIMRKRKPPTKVDYFVPRVSDLNLNLNALK